MTAQLYEETNSSNVRALWNTRPLVPEIYKRMLSQAKMLNKIDPAILSCPFFVAAPKWWEEEIVLGNRIVLVGQETFGWGFQEQCPVDSSILHSITTLSHAADRPDAVNRLVDAYIEFDFGKKISGLSNTPFWRAHSMLCARLGRPHAYHPVMWLNVVSVNFAGPGGGSANMWDNLDWPQVEEVAEWQRGKLLHELTALRPTHVFFMSGPNYDFYLKKEGFKFSECGNYNEIGLVEVSHCDVPTSANMFRIYHPGYILRKKNWCHLERFVESLAK